MASLQLHTGSVLGGRYELLTNGEASTHGDTWSATDQILNRSVRMLLIPEVSSAQLASLEADAREIDARQATDLFPEYMGIVRDSERDIAGLIIAPASGVDIRSAQAFDIVVELPELVDVIRRCAELSASGIVVPRLDAQMLRRHNGGFMVEHPFLIPDSHTPSSDIDQLEGIESTLRSVCRLDEDSVVCRRVERAFPHLRRILDASRSGQIGTLAELVEALSNAVRTPETVVQVVGGGPLVLAESTSAARAALPDVRHTQEPDDEYDEDGTEATAGRRRPHHQSVGEFEVHDPLLGRRRFQLPAGGVLTVIAIAAFLAAALAVSLKGAQSVAEPKRGQEPAKLMRAALIGTSEEQQELTLQLEAYTSTKSSLARVRESGAALERAAIEARSEIRPRKASSAPEGELKRAAIALLSAQQVLGRDVAALSPVPARVSSIDGQVLLVGSQEVTRQYLNTSVALRSLREQPPKADGYTRLPAASKHVLDVVLQQEWKRQEQQLDRRIDAQQRALKQRISSSEQRFRTEMVQRAYTLWKAQFDRIKSEANEEIARGRRLASRYSSSSECQGNALQASISRRGLLLFQLNTLAPPTRQALDQQVALQRRLGTSVAGDVGMLMSSARDRLLSCVDPL